MKIKYFIGIVIISAILSTQILAGNMNVKEIVSKMTLEEKAALVVGARTGGGFGGDGATAVATTERLVDGAAGTTAGISRLEIPPMVLADGPAGLRISPTRRIDPNNTFYCTAFPISTLLASTWDTELVNKVGQAMGNEILEYGVDILLAPALNIHRNPLCGRNFEYYSEDPLVTGKITAAMVKGIQSKGVGTSIKHYAANNQETNRMRIDTIVSERALREIYLEGFRIAVEEAQPWTVMSSYNKINGSFASESHDLLTKVLRDDWGFKGFVMTDWGGGSNPAAQMAAGNDLLMPGSPNQTQSIIAAVKDGTLKESVLDTNIERILNILNKTPRYKKYNFTNKPDLKTNAQTARQAGADGIVLLKNNNSALPFSGGVKNIAAFGNTSYSLIKGGTGSGNVNAAYTIALIEGLQNGGYSVNESVKKAYDDNRQTSAPAGGARGGRGGGMMGGGQSAPEMAVAADLIQKAADESDIAIVTIGRNSGEFSDRQKDGDFYLTDIEKSLIKSVSGAFKAKGKKTVVILNIGGVVETISWRDDPDAILLAWQPGQEAGNAIADVISGKVNPSGKLADTFPVKYEDVPSAENFPGKTTETPNIQPAANRGGRGGGMMGGFGGGGGRGGGGPSEVIYEEDIYVGYRYYNTFKKDVAYEFGYGLSYTTFDYSNVKVSSNKFSDKVTVSVDVKNSGKAAGREVVQVYLSAPAVKLNKPGEELAAFGKTKLLQPGASETLNFDLNARDLASFDTASSSWIAENGNYVVKVGASSRNIKGTASFALDKELVVKKESKALSPQKQINVMRP